MQQFLISKIGLNHLKSALEQLKLPVRVRDKVLTLVCQDFEEIKSGTNLFFGHSARVLMSRLQIAAHASRKLVDLVFMLVTDDNQPVGAYIVRCVHDNQNYRVVFFASEVDKVRNRKKLNIG